MARLSARAQRRGHRRHQLRVLRVVVQSIVLAQCARRLRMVGSRHMAFRHQHFHRHHRLASGAAASGAQSLDIEASAEHVVHRHGDGDLSSGSLRRVSRRRYVAQCAAYRVQGSARAADLRLAVACVDLRSDSDSAAVAPAHRPSSLARCHGDSCIECARRHRRDGDGDAGRLS